MPAEQDLALPPGGRPGDGLERLAAGISADQAGEFGGHPAAAPGDRQPDLAAGARPGRELEVPSLVVAAAAPPQGDARAHQPQVGGVVVLGLELLLVRPGGARHLRQGVQIRQGRARRRVVLGLGLVHIHYHPGVLPPLGGPIRPGRQKRGNLDAAA